MFSASYFTNHIDEQTGTLHTKEKDNIMTPIKKIPKVIKM